MTLDTLRKTSYLVSTTIEIGRLRKNAVRKVLVVILDQHEFYAFFKYRIVGFFGRDMQKNGSTVAVGHGSFIAMKLLFSFFYNIDHFDSS